MPISYKHKIYTTLGTPTNLSGNVVSATDGAGVPAKDYTVKGKSIVWNQLINPSEKLTQTINGITFTNNLDGSWTLDGTASGLVEKSVRSRTYPSGHKMCLLGAFDGADNTYFLRDAWTNSHSVGVGKIFTSITAFDIRISVRDGYTANKVKVIPQLFDLTKMFGPGNEPATPAEFRAMFPDDYYPYNAGELKSIAPTSVEASTVNLLNLVGRKEISSATVGNRAPTDAYPEIDTHVYYRGISPNGYLRSWPVVEATVLSSSVIAKTGTASGSDRYGVGIPLTVVPSTTYYIKCTTSGVVSVGYANSNKVITSFDTPSNNQFTTPGDCRYALIVFRPNALDTQATFENICISAVQTNEYQPYNKYRANIPSSKYFPDGMKSAGSVYDEINFLSQKAIKRVGVRPYQAGDENNTGFITDKKNTVYALSTPVETAITPPLQALQTFKGFTSFSAPNSLMQNGPLSVTYYAEGGASPEKGWLTSYKRKLYMGRTIEWNQLLDKSKYPATQTVNGVTFTNNGDGTITANGAAIDRAVFFLYDRGEISVIRGKGLVIGDPEPGGAFINYDLYDSNGRWVQDNASYGGKGKIFTVDNNAALAQFYIAIEAGTTANNLVFKPQLFDLTQMFGAGNEPATPAEFWSYFDHKLYPYNAGETQPLFKISRKSYIYKEPAGYTVYFADWVWIADTVTITVEYADGSTATLTSQSDVGGKSYSNIVKMTFTDTDSDRYVRYKMPANGGSEETLYMMPTVTLVLTADAEIVEIGK